MATPTSELISRVLTADTAKELHQVTVDAALSILNADACAIATVDLDRLTLYARASTPDTHGDLSRVLSRIRMLGWQNHGSEHAFTIDDLTDTRSTAAADPTGDAQQPYRALLGVPIDGDEIFVAVSTTPAAFSEADQQAAEQLLAAMATARTRVRQQQQEREDDDPDRLEAIASIVSHDVISPLNVVRGSLDLARETGDDTHFERANTALDRVENLLDSVVTLARTGNAFDQPTPVDLRTAAETAWAAVPTREATLEIEASRTIIADESGLCQLLENLFKNASTHAGDGVTVRIGLLDTDTGFYVEDTGPGIPPDQREQVFETGYSSTPDRQGLGLSIVRRLADAHGWDITIMDGTDGGARFEITGITPTESTA